MSDDLSYQEAVKLLKAYKTSYCDLVARCYIMCLVYERYLLDKASHTDLAEEMQELLESLPDEIITGLTLEDVFREPDEPSDEESNDY